MYSLLFLSPLLFVLSGIASAAPTSTCNRDNLLRCFIATPGPASAYCSSVLSSATTTTVATTTPTTTLTISRTSTTTTPVTSFTTSTTSTTTTTTSTQTLQSVTSATTTVTVYVTVTATSLTTTVVATATVTPAAKFKRGIAAKYIIHSSLLHERAVAPPACVTKDGTTPTSYASSRITSACSCIGVTRSTVRATATAPPRTVTTTQTGSATATSTQTATVTVTVTVVSTSTVSTTQVSTASSTATSLTTTTDNTITQIIPSTTTTTASSVCTPTAPACASPTLTNNEQIKFIQTFQGCGLRNRRDGGETASATYNPGTDFCVALSNCIDFATGFSSDDAPDGGFSFDIYRVNTGNIVCNIFTDRGSTAPTEFTNPDTNVNLALGYSRV